jgi:regulator of cell morphogenesis and NO signaling
MVQIQTDRLVSDIVREHPGLSEAFERLGIEYCCGGKRPLREACAEQGLDAHTVVRTLEAVAAAGAGPEAGHEPNPDTLSTPELIDHIVSTHHAFLREQIPRLSELVTEVAEHHGDDDPRLMDVARIFHELSGELMPHQDREEKELFPLLRAAGGAGADGRSGNEAVRLIDELEQDHDRVGELLAELNRLTDGFTPWPAACNTTRAMLDGLARLEADTHRHVHKENNVLFPRFQQ